MTGEIYNDTPVSSYQPPKEIADKTCEIQKDFAIGEEILSKTYPELNNRSVIDDENRGQMMANAFVDTSVEDPNEAWKWRGTRSQARNKGIAMHANLTAGFLLPLFSAQNEDDEIDRDFSEIMRYIIEWMCLPTNSEYQTSFLDIVFGMIENPVTYLGAEFCEVYQTIKEKKDNGEVITKEVLDEVFSGFQCPVYSSSQILITNAYERNMQKQRRIIKRRCVEKSELEAKYGEHPNWIYVQEGYKSIYNEEDNLFYDVKDDEFPHLVWEEIALCRLKDEEIPYVGGIYMGDEDVEANPIKHRDNANRPKYNVVPFGYYRIGQHFFFYKSMMNAVGWDNMLYDAMSEIVMNRAALEVEMPIVVTGSEDVDSDIVFPNSVTSFTDKDTRASPLLPPSNLGAGFQALRETEKSINEGTVNETTSGQLPDAEQKAYNVAQAQASAKKLIGGVAKSLAQSILLYGDLMKDIAINHITVPQTELLLSGNLKLKYKSFVLENKASNGKMVNHVIKFDESLIGLDLSEEDKNMEEMKMLEETGYPENKTTIRKVNPEMFVKFKYLARVDIEEMFVKNQEYWQPVLANLTQMLSQDPLINQQALRRKLMYAYFQSDGDELINKTPPQAPAALPNNPQAAAVQNQRLSTATGGATGKSM